MAPPSWYTAERIEVLDDTAVYSVVTPVLIPYGRDGGVATSLRVELLNEWDTQARLRGLDEPDEDGGALLCLFAAGEKGAAHVVMTASGRLIAHVSMVSR